MTNSSGGADRLNTVSFLELKHIDVGNEKKELSKQRYGNA